MLQFLDIFFRETCQQAVCGSDGKLDFQLTPQDSDRGRVATLPRGAFMHLSKVRLIELLVKTRGCC